MPSKFELFKKQIDDAVNLIDKSVTIDNIKSSMEVGEALDTQSLLERCDYICEKYGAKKPTLRIIHQLDNVCSRSVLKYLSSLPNVFILSGAHPFSDVLNKKDCISTDMISLAKIAKVPQQNRLAEKIFKQSIVEVYEHVHNIGGLLIINGIDIPGIKNDGFNLCQSQFFELLEDSYDIKSVLIIRNPVDCYLALVEKYNKKTKLKSFTDYCNEFESLLDKYPCQDVFSLENLTKETTRQMKEVAKSLDICFEPSFDSFIEQPLYIDDHDFECGYLKEVDKDVETIKRLNKKLSYLNIDLFQAKNKRFMNGIHLSSASVFDLPGYIKKNGHVCITVAGMRHSGSTALFNIIRLAINQLGLSLSSGYSERLTIDKELSIKNDVLLIKTHEMRDDVRDVSNIIITTIRDLRDTVASASRREFPMLSKIGSVPEYAKYNRILHESWEPYSNLVFNYERFIENPIKVISDLLNSLGLNGVNCKEIYSQVSALPVDDYNLTLLSPTHITDPNRVSSYEKTLTAIDIEKINSQHSTWLKKFGYLI